MKQCSKCNQQYDDRIQYCFRDGMTLEQSISTVKALHLDKITDTPISATAFDVDTLDISISDILDIQALSMDIGLENISASEPSLSPNVSTVAPSGSNDIEDIVLQSSIGVSTSIDTSDVDTVDFHIDDFENSVPSVDNAQSVAQALVTQTLDMDEGFLPGDTLDLPEGDVFTEDVKRKAMQSGTGAMPVTMEQWQQSGPIMEEALKQAKEQRAKVKMDASGTGSSSTVAQASATQNTITPTPASSGFPKIMIAAIILVAAVFFFMGSGTTNTSDGTSTKKPNLQVPTINSTVPVVPVVPTKSETENVQSVDNTNIENSTTIENTDTNGTETPSAIDGVDGIEKAPITEDTQQGNVVSAEGNSIAPSNTESTNNIQQSVPMVPSNTNVPVEPSQKEPITSAQATTSATSTQKVATSTQKENSVPKNSESKNTETQKTTTKVDKPAEKKADPPKNTTQATQSVSWGATVECFVIFNANVSSAKVFVDGVEKGTVGKKLSVDCGDHKAEVKASGYKTQTRNISVNGTSNFTIDLPKE